MFRSTPRATPLVPWPPAVDVNSVMDEPLAYSINEALGVLCIDLLEVQDAEAVIQAFHRIRLDPAFRPGMHVCVDCRALSHVPSADHVGAIVTPMLQGIPREFNGRYAIIASSACAFDSARLFVALARQRPDRVRVFRSNSDALIWLQFGPSVPTGDSEDRGATPSAWLTRVRVSGQLVVESGGTKKTS